MGKSAGYTGESYLYLCENEDPLYPADFPIKFPEVFKRMFPKFSDKRKYCDGQRYNSGVPYHLTKIQHKKQMALTPKKKDF
jgi:hypothetical protein